MPAPLEPMTSRRSPGRTSRSTSWSAASARPGHCAGRAAQAQPVAESRAHACRRDGLRREAVGQPGRARSRRCARPMPAPVATRRRRAARTANTSNTAIGTRTTTASAGPVERTGRRRRARRRGPRRSRRAPARSDTSAAVPAWAPARRVDRSAQRASAAGCAPRLAPSAPHAMSTSRLPEVIGDRVGELRRAAVRWRARPRDPAAQPQSVAASPAATRHASRVSAAGHHTNATKMTAPSATVADGDERLHDPQRQVLQVVDVVDERAEHGSAPRSGQAVGRERDQPSHEGGAGGWRADGGRRRGSRGARVAEDRARQREEPHPDDGRREVEHRRLLARAHDQPRAHREEGDGGCLGQESGPRPARSGARRHRAAQDRGGGRVIGCRGIRARVLRGSHDHLARFEPHDVVGELSCTRAVRDQQHGGTVVGWVAHPSPQAGSVLGVERCARLVQRDHGRCARAGAGRTHGRPRRAAPVRPRGPRPVRRARRLGSRSLRAGEVERGVDRDGSGRGIAERDVVVPSFRDESGLLARPREPRRRRSARMSCPARSRRPRTPRHRAARRAGSSCPTPLGPSMRVTVPGRR